MDDAQLEAWLREQEAKGVLAPVKPAYEVRTRTHMKAHTDTTTHGHIRAGAY